MPPRRAFLRLLGPIVWLALLCTAVPAQLQAQTTSVIQGIIVDPHGRPISGATVCLSSPTLALEAEVVSDATGSYRLPGLPSGTYNLKVTKADFAAKTYTALLVTVNSILT